MVKFGDIVEGITMEEKRRRADRSLDQGRSSTCKDLDMRPRVSIKDADGKT